MNKNSSCEQMVHPSMAENTCARLCNRSNASLYSMRSESIGLVVFFPFFTFFSSSSLAFVVYCISQSRLFSSGSAEMFVLFFFLRFSRRRPSKISLRSSFSSSITLLERVYKSPFSLLSFFFRHLCGDSTRAKETYIEAFLFFLFFYFYQLCAVRFKDRPIFPF